MYIDISYIWYVLYLYILYLIYLIFDSDYKNLFQRKKSNRPRAALDLARVEKGEVLPDSTAPKYYFPLFVKIYYWVPHHELGHQTVKTVKQTRSFSRNKSKIERKSTTEILPN